MGLEVVILIMQQSGATILSTWETWRHVYKQLTWRVVYLDEATNLDSSHLERNDQLGKTTNLGLLLT